MGGGASSVLSTDDMSEDELALMKIECEKLFSENASLFASGKKGYMLLQLFVSCFDSLSETDILALVGNKIVEADFTMLREKLDKVISVSETSSIDEAGNAFVVHKYYIKKQLVDFLIAENENSVSLVDKHAADIFMKFQLLAMAPEDIDSNCSTKDWTPLKFEESYCEYFINHFLSHMVYLDRKSCAIRLMYDLEWHFRIIDAKGVSHFVSELQSLLLTDKSWMSETFRDELKVLYLFYMSIYPSLLKFSECRQPLAEQIVRMNCSGLQSARLQYFCGAATAMLNGIEHCRFVLRRNRGSKFVFAELKSSGFIGLTEEEGAVALALFSNCGVGHNMTDVTEGYSGEEMFDVNDDREFETEHAEATGQFSLLSTSPNGHVFGVECYKKNGITENRCKLFGGPSLKAEKLVVGHVDYGSRDVSHDLAADDAVEDVDQKEYPKEYSNCVLSVAYLSDGRAVTGGKDATVVIWDKDFNKESILRGHKLAVTSVAVLPDGRIVSGSRDGKIRVWQYGNCLNPRTNTQEHMWATSHYSQNNKVDSQVKKVLVLPNGTVVGCFEHYSLVYKKINVTEKESDEELRSIEVRVKDFTLTEEDGIPGFHCVLGSGKVAVSGGSSHAIRIWDIEEDEVDKELIGHEAEVIHLSLLPCGALVSGSRDNVWRVWNAESGECSTLASYLLGSKEANTFIFPFILADGDYVKHFVFNSQFNTYVFSSAYGLMGTFKPKPVV